MSEPTSNHYRTYGVSAHHRGPLLDFMLRALKADGCRILYSSPANLAPYRITIETADGERLGIVAYAFYANCTRTKNRPLDECRFQIKYGAKEALKDRPQHLWQDPYGLYTTLLVGINPEDGYFVGADPVLHSPTRFFISVEFKKKHVAAIKKHGWHVWERDRRARDDRPVEVLVGGTISSFLRYIRFEREALREDQGHRHLLAEQLLSPTVRSVAPAMSMATRPPEDRLHALAREFDLSPKEVLDLIAGARRLKMAVRGFVAERHLVHTLSTVPGVTDIEHVDEEGAPDVALRFEGSRLLRIECKNALRNRTKAGLVRLDLQRTRASKKDPCSRYYRVNRFDLIAACIHSVTERWEFRYAIPRTLEIHTRCPGRLSNNVKLDERWREDIAEMLRLAAAG